jgi:hypothetical protein
MFTLGTLTFLARELKHTVKVYTKHFRTHRLEDSIFQYGPQITSWFPRGVNVLSTVRGGGGSTKHTGGRKTSYWSAIRRRSDAYPNCKHRACSCLVLFFLWGTNAFTLDSNEHTSVRGTLHGRKTRIPCGDELVICGLYVMLLGIFHIALTFMSLRASGCQRYFLWTAETRVQSRLTPSEILVDDVAVQ